MGNITSMLCSITICAERTMTWCCCAIMVVLLMMGFIALILYGMHFGFFIAEEEMSYWHLRQTTTPLGGQLHIWPFRTNHTKSPVTEKSSIRKLNEDEGSEIKETVEDLGISETVPFLVR